MNLEQICKHEKSNKYRKWLKRVAKKLMRRLSKQLKDEAPKRYKYNGYSN